MSTLITGGSGFVGLNIVEALLAQAETVISCDLTDLQAPIAAHLARLPGTLRQERLDVRDRSALASVFEKHRPVRVVHAAAITPCAGDELACAATCISVNIGGTANVLDASAAGRVKRVVMLSSAAVYGDAGLLYPELEEATPAQPVSIYGTSKFAAERIALQYRQARLEVIALRVGSVFGPWEHVNTARGTLSPMWQVLGLARAGEAVFLPRPGRRDWIYARDVAAAILSALRHTAPLPEVANVGAGSQSTVADFCAFLANAGVRFSWTIDPRHPNVDLHSGVDRAPLSIAVLRNGLRFLPRYGLEAATADYLAWAEAWDGSQGVGRVRGQPGD